MNWLKYRTKNWVSSCPAWWEDRPRWTQCSGSEQRERYGFYFRQLQRVLWRCNWILRHRNLCYTKKSRITQWHSIICYYYILLTFKILFFQTNGEHVWLSRLNTSAIKWAPGQPDFYKKREDCVEMNWSGKLESDEYVDIKKKTNLESLTTWKSAFQGYLKFSNPYSIVKHERVKS